MKSGHIGESVHYRATYFKCMWEEENDKKQGCNVIHPWLEQALSKSKDNFVNAWMLMVFYLIFWTAIYDLDILELGLSTCLPAFWYSVSSKLELLDCFAEPS